MMGEIGIIILAAGASKRLGYPKQLVHYLGKPLIQRMTEMAVNSSCQPVVVVLGAYGEVIESQINNYDLNIVFNQDWSIGMASSIQCGLNKIQAIAPNLDGVIIMLCDQPFVSTELINQLVAEYRTKQSLIVASEYNNVLGVPALFAQSLFAELINLEGDIGARKLIQGYGDKVLSIPFERGEVDLDTQGDLLTFSLMNY